MYQLSDTEVECLSESKQKHLNTRMLRVTRDDRSLDVKHMHFTGWPDWETPVGDSLETYRSVVDEGAKFVIK